MRIRFIKSTKFYLKGQTYDITYLTALSYIKKGFAIKDKMLDWNNDK